MTIVKTAQGVISYQIFGEGPPLIMLRGLGRTVRHWVGFEHVMAKHFRVLVTDLRGMGETRLKHRIFDSVWDYADDIIQVMNHAKWPDAHVMGVSLGGMATLALGLRYPERCRSLVLVNSSIGGQGLRRISNEALMFLVKSLALPQEKLQRVLIDLLVGKDCPEERREDLAEAYVNIAREQGLFVGTVVKQLFAALRFNPTPYLPDLKVPMLVICGAEDKFVPNMNSQNLANLVPRSQLIMIPGAGHEPSTDKGMELARAIHQWSMNLSCTTAASHKKIIHKNYAPGSSH